MILAIDTAEVAAGEENITYPLSSSNGRLLTPVDAYGGHMKPCTGPAVARRGLQAVHPAFPRADQALNQCFNAVVPVRGIHESVKSMILSSSQALIHLYRS